MAINEQQIRNMTPERRGATLIVPDVFPNVGGLSPKNAIFPEELTPIYIFPIAL